MSIFISKMLLWLMYFIQCTTRTFKWIQYILSRVENVNWTNIFMNSGSAVEIQKKPTIDIPIWLYDSVLLLYLTFNLVTHCKRPHNRTFKSLRRKIWNLTCALLKLVAQIMLCLKLELEVPNSNFKLPLYYVMIPVWIVLPVTVVDVFYTMYHQNV